MTYRTSGMSWKSGSSFRSQYSSEPSQRSMMGASRRAMLEDMERRFASGTVPLVQGRNERRGDEGNGGEK